MNIFLIIGLIWLASEVYLNRFMRSKKESIKHEKGSLGIIWITIIASIFAGVWISKTVHLSIDQTAEIIPYIGLSLIVVGMLFRFLAIRTLGKYFTVDIAISRDHKIKDNGLYTYLRHPSYTGSLVSFLGFGLSLNNWISVFVVIIPVTWAFLNRIKAEEKMLMDQFGDQYISYMKRTKRIIPFIY